MEDEGYINLKNSSNKKNRVNILEFESGRNFMSGKTVEDINSRNKHMQQLTTNQLIRDLKDDE